MSRRLSGWYSSDSAASIFDPEESIEIQTHVRQALAGRGQSFRGDSTNDHSVQLVASVHLFDEKPSHQEASESFRTAIGKSVISSDETPPLIVRSLGRFAVVESESSPSDDEHLLPSTENRISAESDDPSWSGLAEDVKDILRMKRDQQKDHNQK